MWGKGVAGPFPAHPPVKFHQASLSPWPSPEPQTSTRRLPQTAINSLVEVPACPSYSGEKAPERKSNQLKRVIPRLDLRPLRNYMPYTLPKNTLRSRFYNCAVQENGLENFFSRQILKSGVEMRNLHFNGCPSACDKSTGHTPQAQKHVHKPCTCSRAHTHTHTHASAHVHTHGLA